MPGLTNLNLYRYFFSVRYNWIFVHKKEWFSLALFCWKMNLCNRFIESKLCRMLSKLSEIGLLENNGWKEVPWPVLWRHFDCKIFICILQGLLIFLRMLLLHNPKLFWIHTSYTILYSRNYFVEQFKIYIVGLQITTYLAFKNVF